MEELSGMTLELMPNEMPENLFILWNMGGPTDIKIDGRAFHIDQYCMIFLSEFHLTVSAHFERVRIIEFSKAFLGVDSAQNQVGDFLQLFYGHHFLDNISKIKLSHEQVDSFESLWITLQQEAQEEDLISLALLRNSFQRLMLLAQQVHIKTEFDLPITYTSLRLIREFQFLVETHFMDLTRVSDYADRLKVSAKKLSELFKKYYHRRPIDLIAHRRNLHARKQLIHTNELIKNIAYDLNFADPQSFIHFFRKMNGTSPESFRQAALNSEKWTPSKDISAPGPHPD